MNFTNNLEEVKHTMIMTTPFDISDICDIEYEFDCSLIHKLFKANLIIFSESMLNSLSILTRRFLLKESLNIFNNSLESQVINSLLYVSLL